MNTSQEDRERIDALSDLRRFVEIIEARGELERIENADPHLEMGGLYELSLRDRYPPALMFERIQGCNADRRVLTNVRFSKIFVGPLDLDAVIRHRAAGKWEEKSIPPEEVETGPVFQNIITGDAVNIYDFPAVKWHDQDGGPYIGTECLVINKDPESDWVNLGTYRTQMHAPRKLTVFMEPGKHGALISEKYWSKGLPCPMAVSVGQAPILGVVAGTSSRSGISEYATAGGRIGQPIKVVRGKLTGLPIPADAELVFEGFMSPPTHETLPEGPFAEWPGYYSSDGGPQPVLQVGAIYHRDNPIIIGQPPAKPTYPGRQPSIEGIAALWDSLEAAGVPGITGVWKLDGGGARFINVIRIKQMYPGHAKMAGLVATGSRAGAYLGRMTIVVDDDIDIMNIADVMWALATRWDPKTQTDIIDGCWTGHIDPALSPEKRASGDITNSRIIMYAVRPYHWKDEFPKVNAFETQYLDELARKWTGRVKFLSK